MNFIINIKNVNLNILEYIIFLFMNYEKIINNPNELKKY